MTIHAILSLVASIQALSLSRLVHKMPYVLSSHSCSISSSNKGYHAHKHNKLDTPFPRSDQYDGSNILLLWPDRPLSSWHGWRYQSPMQSTQWCFHQSGFIWSLQDPSRSSNFSRSTAISYLGWAVRLHPLLWWTHGASRPLFHWIQCKLHHWI